MNAQDAHRFVDEHDLADNVAAVARAAPELNAAQRAAIGSLLFQNAQQRPAPETGWPPSPKPTAAPPAVNVRIVVAPRSRGRRATPSACSR